MPRSIAVSVFGACALLSVLWTLTAGKDVNWDLLNYHYYAPFEFIAGRLGQDFFAASAQSYLNPLGYLPFYLMVAAGWHSVIVSVLLALVHSASAGLLFVIAWKMFGQLQSRERVQFASLATALGCATWVFWPTVGTSFIDPLLTPLMLGGLVLLLPDPGRALERPLPRIALAGALFGASAALKYSNGIFVLAALPLTIALPSAGALPRARTALAFIGGVAFALLALAGPWFVLMVREFGNPVFPLLNGWFQSPYAPPYNITNLRFQPEDFLSALTFPFRMALLDRRLYSENFAPDVRLALLVAAAAVLPLAARMQKLSDTKLRATDWRVIAFFTAAALLWLATSANGRYGLIVLFLAGACLARLVERLLPQSAARVALCVLVVVQIVISVMAAPTRWYTVEPWSTRWLPYEVPPRALAEPALYLTVEPLPMAVLAPFVHPQSSFVNFRGQYSIPTGSPKLAELLERHRNKVRALGRALRLVDGKPDPDVVRGYDATLVRIGFKVDPSDCFTIAWRPEQDQLARAMNYLARNPQAQPDFLSAASCALHPIKRDPADLAAETRFSSVFDRIEKACPALFRGQSAVTEPLGAGWSRHYPGLDVRLESDGTLVLLNQYRIATYFHLGEFADWEANRPPRIAACAAASALAP
jgi:hypothetical protein